jgi:transcriptional regulator with XRE-family HTH domain
MEKRIKILREVLNMKQGDFSRRISTTQGHVSDIENGRKELSDRTIKLICLEFNVNEDWLRNGTGEMFVQNDNTIIGELSRQYDLDAMDRQLIETYLNLPDDQRSAIKKYLCGLAEVISTFNTVSATTDPIESELESYHKELDAEQKARTVSEELNAEKA